MIILTGGGKNERVVIHTRTRININYRRVSVLIGNSDSSYRNMEKMDRQIERGNVSLSWKSYSENGC